MLEKESSLKKSLNELSDFLKDSGSFLLFSLLLVLPPGLINKFLGGGYLDQALEVFGESLAPRTIVALFISSVMITSLVLFFAGHENEAKDGKFKKFLFAHLINKQIQFGVSFCAASFGMLIGLSITLFILGYLGMSLGIFFSSLLIFAYAILFKLIELVSKKGIDDSLGTFGQKALLALIFFVAPFLFWLTHTPIKECMN